MSVGMGIATAWWAIAPGYWRLVLFALTFGLFYGGWVAFAPALVADLFGRKHVGAIIGAFYTGTLIGPGLAGVVYDTWAATSPRSR